mgnify:CR=1 FL=1
MSITKAEKKEIFAEFGSSEEDTGSSDAQVALFTHRINHITDHLKEHENDHSSRRNLLQLVGKRRRLLNYIKDNDVVRYRELIKKLGIRK